jgi:parallel beta helix pectate lyase-like protein
MKTLKAILYIVLLLILFANSAAYASDITWSDDPRKYYCTEDPPLIIYVYPKHYGKNEHDKGISYQQAGVDIHPLDVWFDKCSMQYAPPTKTNIIRERTKKDKAGGIFLSPRSKVHDSIAIKLLGEDNVRRVHGGYDYITKPGELIYATMSGRIKVWKAKRGWMAVNIISIDSGIVSRVLYIVPNSNIKNGMVVVAGETVLGRADNLKNYPEYDSCPNHVHVDFKHPARGIFNPYTLEEISYAAILKSSQAKETTKKVTQKRPNSVHYVRYDAKGNNSGSDWNNAYRELPSTLIRGDTYYIAGGYYPEYSFDDPASGSTYIYIKKATVDDHGTNTGWESSYGNGTVFFESSGTVFTFETMYYDLDGVTGSGTSNHGIVVQMNGASSATYGVSLRGGTGFINLRHMEIYHSNPCGVGDVAQDGIRSVGPDNITISYCYIHSWHRNCIIATDSQNWTVEYSHLSQNWTVEYSHLAESHSTSSNHGQAIYMGYRSASNWNIRHNTFKDINGSAVIFFSGACSNISVYGNLFWEEQTKPDCGNFSVGGIIGHNNSGGDVTGLNFHNNTILGFTGRGSAGSLNLDSGSNNQAYNNIWYDSIGMSFNATTHDYNASDASLNESNQAFISSSVFNNYNGNDFTLSGTFPSSWGGTTLQSPFTTDRNNTQRGIDDVWDHGAYEYNTGDSSGGSPPQIPAVPNGVAITRDQ